MKNVLHALQTLLAGGEITTAPDNAVEVINALKAECRKLREINRTLRERVIFMENKDKHELIRTRDDLKIMTDQWRVQLERAQRLSNEVADLRNAK